MRYNAVAARRLRRHRAMPPPPPLETARLRLTPVAAADFRWLQDVMERPDVNASTLAIPTPCPPEFAAGWIAAADADNAAGKGCAYSVSAGDMGSVGTVRLLVDPATRHGELCFFFDPIAWGQGYATEASARVLRYAFETLKLERVFALNYPDNPVAARVLEKIGMRREGIHRERPPKGGEAVDIERFEILPG